MKLERAIRIDVRPSQRVGDRTPGGDGRAERHADRPVAPESAQDDPVRHRGDPRHLALGRRAVDLAQLRPSAHERDSQGRYVVEPRPQAVARQGRQGHVARHPASVPRAPGVRSGGRVHARPGPAAQRSQ